MVFLILIWQALRGQALISVDALTMTALLVWAGVTAGLAAWPFRPRTRRSDADGALNWINP
jgi:hypothetical protein